VTTGRPIASEDVDGATKVALLGRTKVQNLFGDADPLGQIIRIKKVPFTVIGLLDRKGQEDPVVVSYPGPDRSIRAGPRARQGGGPPLSQPSHRRVPEGARDARPASRRSSGR